MAHCCARVTFLPVPAVPVPPGAPAQAGSPAGPVPVERLSARRAALIDRIGTGVAVVRSGSLRSLERDYPQDSDYREDSDFFYLTGLEAPGGALVLVARRGAPDSVISICRNGRPAPSVDWPQP